MPRSATANRHGAVRIAAADVQQALIDQTVDFYSIVRLVDEAVELGRQPIVLQVRDNAGLCESLQGLLRFRQAYRVSVVSSRSDVSTQLLDRSFHVVLVDLYSARRDAPYWANEAGNSQTPTTAVEEAAVVG